MILSLFRIVCPHHVAGYGTAASPSRKLNSTRYLRIALDENSRLRRMCLNFGVHCFLLLESTRQTCSVLSCLLVVTNKGVDGLLRSNGLRDLNDTHSLCTGHRWFLGFS